MLLSLICVTAVCFSLLFTFQASEIEAGYGGMIMRYETRYGACTETGRMGGLKP